MSVLLWITPSYAATMLIVIIVGAALQLYDGGDNPYKIRVFGYRLILFSLVWPIYLGVFATPLVIRDYREQKRLANEQAAKSVIAQCDKIAEALSIREDAVKAQVSLEKILKERYKE